LTPLEEVEARKRRKANVVDDGFWIFAGCGGAAASFRDFGAWNKETCKKVGKPGSTP